MLIIDICAVFGAILTTASFPRHISAKLEQYENSSDSDDSVVVGPAVIGDGNREFARRVAVPPPPRDKMREQLGRDAEWDRVRGLDRGAADKLKPKGREVSHHIIIIINSVFEMGGGG